MPNYNTHKKIGLITSLIIGLPLTYLFDFTWSQGIFALGIVLFYANIPDIDHHLSRLKRYILTGIFISMILSPFLYLLIPMNYYVIFLFLIGAVGLALYRIPHRGPLHSIGFCLFISAPLLLFHWMYFVLAATSSLSHILADQIYSKYKKVFRKPKHLNRSTSLNKME